LSELDWALKPRGRFVNFATNWAAVFWHSRKPGLNRQILAAWDARALAQPTSCAAQSPVRERLHRRAAVSSFGFRRYL